MGNGEFLSRNIIEYSPLFKPCPRPMPSCPLAWLDGSTDMQGEPGTGMGIQHTDVEICPQKRVLTVNYEMRNIAI